MIQKTLFQLAVIVFGSLILGAAFDGFRSEGIGIFNSESKGPGHSGRSPLSAQEILSKMPRTLTLSEALVLFEDKAAVFIDARPPSFYQTEHIQGAMSIYYKTAGLNPALDQLNKSNAYVVYCKGPNCNQAQLLISTMQKAGFTNLFIFPGGMQEWRLAQYPMDGNSSEVKNVK